MKGIYLAFLLILGCGEEVCVQDLKVCPDGSLVARHLDLDCKFPECPEYNERLAGHNEMCGGIAGFMCQAGLKCQLDGDFPDASGFCVYE